MPPKSKKTSAPVDPAKELEQEVEAAVKDIEKEYSNLKGKTVEELRQLHADALLMESEAKRELHILMQRFAMKGTNVEEEALADLRVAMQKVDDAGRYLKALEGKLYGELKDIWGTYF